MSHPTEVLNYTTSVPVTIYQGPESNLTNISSTAAGVPSGGNVRVADLYTQPLYITIGVVGLLGNGFVVLVISRSKSMRQKLTNVFIIHQSVVDLVVSFFLLLTSATSRANYNLHGLAGELICRLWLTSLPMWSAVLTSTYNLVALTVERYLEICHPIKHKVSFTKNKAAVVIALVWMMGLVHQLPTHLPTAGVVNGQCFVLKFWPSKAANQAFGVINVVVRYYIPLIIMVACYTAMIRVIRQQVKVHAGSSTGQQQSTSTHSQKMNKAKQNVFKTLLMVTVAFILCWTMNQILFFMFNFGFVLDFGSWWYNLSVVLVNINCCINPFIYVAKYDAFKKSMKTLLHLDRSSVHPENSTLTGSLVSSQVDRNPRHVVSVTLPDVAAPTDSGPGHI